MTHPRAHGVLSSGINHCERSFRQAPGMQLTESLHGDELQDEHTAEAYISQERISD